MHQARIANSVCDAERAPNFFPSKQEPAFIGDPHKAPQPLQRGSNFGFGSAFGVPGAAAHGMGVAPAPLFQPVQTGEAAHCTYAQV